MKSSYWACQVLTFFKKINNLVTKVYSIVYRTRLDIEALDKQDLSRFSPEDIVLETDVDVKRVLPDILGQALARAWVDQRFMDAFIHHPRAILEYGGVFLPENISVEFIKEEKKRPKVIVYEINNKMKKKLLELKLIMVAEQ